MFRKNALSPVEPVSLKFNLNLLKKNVCTGAWGLYHCEVWEGSDVCNLTSMCGEAISIVQIHDMQVTLKRPYHCAKFILVY